jgi:hypothetical protein
MQSNVVDGVHSIVLKYFTFNYAVNDPIVNLVDAMDCTSNMIPVVEVRKCTSSGCPCNCIVFSCPCKEITTILSLRMSQTLKPLSTFLCLLPFLTVPWLDCEVLLEESQL